MSSQLFSSAAVLILTAALCFSTLAEARCDQDGWFGTNCQYQCHCAQSVPCDKVDGSCSSGCDPQWFGPACQYASIRLTESNWLTDNDDSTCYPNNAGISIHLSLATPVPLTWIRVVHKGNLNDLRIMYIKDERPGYHRCPLNANVVVDDHTMDFNCTTSHAVQKIYVDNQYRGLQSLCSLYISGGRNVALKQPTKQSTWLVHYEAPRASYISEYAVDGRLPDSTLESNYGTCTRTKINLVLNWWTVNFNTPVDVTRILIYNRRDCCRDRLKKFTLTALQNGSKQYSVTGPDEEREMYSVVPSPKISSAVTQIEIQSSLWEILTLCEVEVFGELRCPTGRFGLACEHECHCDSQTNCFVHSGRCKAGCAPGYGGATCSERCLAGKYGRGCSQNCSQHCKGGKTACNHIDGKCDECKDGYRGETCMSECATGYYGEECKERCSAHCAGDLNSCNHVNGNCDLGCDPGYDGLLCTQNSSQQNIWGISATVVAAVLAIVVIIALVVRRLHKRFSGQIRKQATTENVTELELHRAATPGTINEGRGQITHKDTISSEDVEEEAKYTEPNEIASCFFASPVEIGKDSRTYEEPSDLIKFTTNNSKISGQTGIYEEQSIPNQSSEDNVDNSHYIGIYEELSPLAQTAENPPDVFEYSTVDEGISSVNDENKCRETGTYKNLSP